MTWRIIDVFGKVRVEAKIRLVVRPIRIMKHHYCNGAMRRAQMAIEHPTCARPTVHVRSPAPCFRVFVESFFAVIMTKWPWAKITLFAQLFREMRGAKIIEIYYFYAISHGPDPSVLLL
jgi:hypothetical protein